MGCGLIWNDVHEKERKEENGWYCIAATEYKWLWVVGWCETVGKEKNVKAKGMTNNNYLK